MVRPLALLLLVSLAASAQARDASCVTPVAREAAQCEQERAEAALNALSHRYARIWAQLPAERRIAFATAERRWLNGGRWDDHAACVTANASGAAPDVVGARCLADVTVAHLHTLDSVAPLRVAAPHH